MARYDQKARHRVATLTWSDALAKVEGQSAYQVPKARHRVAMLAPNPALLKASQVRTSDG